MKRSYSLSVAEPVISKRSKYSKSKGRGGIQKRVKQLLDRQVETKCHGQSLTESQLSNLSLHAWDLSQIEAGPASNQRDGQVVSPKYMDIKVLLHNENTGAPVLTRVLLLKTKASENNVTQDSGLFLTATNAQTSFNNLANYQWMWWPINKQKYVPIVDRTVALTQDGTNVFPNSRLIQIKKKLYGKIRFDRNNTGADYQDTRYVLVIMSVRNDLDESLSGGTVEVSWHARLFYKDY